MIAKFKKSKKKERENFIYSILLSILVLGIIILLALSNFNLYKKRRKLSLQIESLKREIQILKETNASLKTKIDQTKSEDYWKEKLYQQGYVKKGEKQVVVLPPEKGKKEKISKEKNLWQKLLEKIGL